MRYLRWLIPRFSLRTLFVMLTIVGLWLGWEASIVRQRLAVRDQLKTHGIQFVPGRVADTYNGPLLNIAGAVLLVRDGSVADVPSWSRRLLGDQEILMVELPRSITDEDAKLLSCFPEATVFRCDFVTGPARTP